MNIALKGFPRLDAGRAGFIDLTALGTPRKDSAGRVSFGSLGTQIKTGSQLKAKMAVAYSRALGLPVEDRKVQDAATDFVGSGLTQYLGPQEDVRRSSDSKFIFVPKPGRPLALQSRNLLQPGMRTNVYRIRENSGVAQWVNPSGGGMRNLPRSSYSVEEKENGAQWYASAWAYSLPDTWEADLLNEDLLGELQTAATDALDIMREQVSTWGDVGKKLPGLVRLGDAIIMLGGQRFSSNAVTAKLMLEKLSHIDLVYQNANNEMQANRLLAPVADKVAMQTTFFGQESVGDSVWKRAIELYPWIANAIWSNRMGLANAAGDAPRWVLYPDDQSKIYIEHTETMLFGPFTDMLEQTFIMLRRHGGVVSKMPEQVVYVDFTT